MANPVCEVLLTDDPLRPGRDIPGGSGAIVDFFGVVRPLEGDREIGGIDYEAHETMAKHQLEMIAREAIVRFELTGAIVHHRVGFVPAGEASVFVRTTSRNRAESYQANAWMMEELKKKAPIWKRPQFKPEAEAAESAAEGASPK
jgi:molybdopterin synthase catalytic subunit